MIRLKNTSYQMAPPRTTLAAPTLLGKCLLVHTIMKVCVNQKEVTVLINTTTKLKKIGNYGKVIFKQPAMCSILMFSSKPWCL